MWHRGERSALDTGSQPHHALLAQIQSAGWGQRHMDSPFQIITSFQSLYQHPRCQQPPVPQAHSLQSSSRTFVFLSLWRLRPIKFLCHFSTVLLILPFPFQICSLPPLCSSPVSAALCPALPKSCYAQARAQVLSFSSENLCLYYPTLLPMHRRTLNTYQNRELARV